MASNASEAGFSPSGAPLSYSFGYSNTVNQSGYTVCGSACQVTDVALPRGSTTAWSAPAIHYAFNTPPNPANDPVASMHIISKTLTHTDPYTAAGYTDNWTYSGSQGTGMGVVGPDGSATNYYTYPPGDGPLSGHAYKIDKLDASGHYLSRLEQLWTPNTSYGTTGENIYLKADFRSVFPQGSTTPSLSAIRVYSEDVNGNVGEVDESDWAPYSAVTGLSHDNFGGITQVPSITALRSTVSSYYVSAATSPYWNTWSTNILDADSPRFRSLILF